MKSSISNHELLALIRNNDVAILDVRNRDEFNHGHISGAINIPVDELPKRHIEIQNGKVIVTYCGKGGGRSENAAKILIENGKPAFWLEGGYLDWSVFSPNSLSKEDLIISKKI